jgi:competence protein ComEC
VVSATPCNHLLGRSVVDFRQRSGLAEIVDEPREAATLGLVALVQFGMPRLLASAESSTTARVALWGGRELMMLLLASMVAGLATTLYAAFHFHRVTPYSVLANLAAMPVVSAIVMPAGLIGLAAMPFGLDGRGGN